MAGPFTEDQEELRRYVRRWLDERAPFDVVRRIMESDRTDPVLWRELGELGWPGMTIAPSFGGAGYGFGEMAVLAEEMGRTLFPSPFLASVVLGSYLIDSLAPEDFKGPLLSEIASGTRTATVAVADRDGEWKTDGFSTVAQFDGDRWVLSGSKGYVLDGYSADTLLVAASTDKGTGIFLTERRGSAAVFTPLDVMDLTRPLANVDFDECEVELLAVGDRAVDALTKMTQRGVAYLAMEQVGAAQACLDMSVAYAKQRHQFGRAIGSFQAIKHMCAEMLVEIESAKSAAYHLASVIDTDPVETAVVVPLAKSYCSEVFYRCASDTIQIHGGIGFTWEHDAHLYFKRAKSSSLLFGAPSTYRQSLADRIGAR